jgi:hypothetical protein
MVRSPRRLVPAVTLAVLFVLAGPPPALAQSAPDRLNGMISDLNALIERGAQRNLADPWFLDELRALSARYGETWPRVLMDHSFDSQSGTPKPPWQVRAGRMQVDWSRGLRSRVEPAAAPQSGGQQPPSRDEAVGALVGQLLGQALGTGQPQPRQGDTSSGGDPGAPAVAAADVSISNAFRIQAEMSGRPTDGADQGGFEIGVFQAGNAGYRLVITPNADGSRATVELLVVSSRETARVIDSVPVTVPVLGDAPFTVTWSRHPNGRIVVAVNGTDFIAVDDRTFSDPFQGVLLVNRGGDWAVKRMTIKGT